MGDRLKILGGVTILGISTFLGTYSGIELYKNYGENRVVEVKDAETEQLNTFLSNLAVAIASQDSKALQQYIKPNGFIMDSSDYQRLVEYFTTTKKRVKFITRIQKQYQYLAQGNLTTDTMFYLAGENNQFVIKVNPVTVKIKVKSIADKMDIKTAKGSDTYNIKNKEVEIKNQLPIYDELICNINGNEEKCTIDYIGEFCKSSYSTGLSTEIDKYMFKHGAGITILADIPQDDCKLYINGKYAHVTLNKGIQVIDTLNSGDKVYLKYKTETSNKIVASPTTGTVEFKFPSKKDKGDNKTISSNNSELNAIANELFTKINNGVNTSNPNILSSIVKPSIQNGAENFMNNLIKDYKSIDFDALKDLKYQTSGNVSRITGRYSYRYVSVDDGLGSRNSTFIIDVENGKIIYFSLN